jgi:hypothetical protein
MVVDTEVEVGGEGGGAPRSEWVEVEREREDLVGEALCITYQLTSAARSSSEQRVRLGLAASRRWQNGRTRKSHPSAITRHELDEPLREVREAFSTARRNAAR